MAKYRKKEGKCSMMSMIHLYLDEIQKDGKYIFKTSELGNWLIKNYVRYSVSNRTLTQILRTKKFILGLSTIKMFDRSENKSNKHYWVIKNARPENIRQSLLEISHPDPEGFKGHYQGSPIETNTDFNIGAGNKSNLKKEIIYGR